VHACVHMLYHYCVYIIKFLFFVSFTRLLMWQIKLYINNKVVYVDSALANQLSNQFKHCVSLNLLNKSSLMR